MCDQTDANPLDMPAEELSPSADDLVPHSSIANVPVHLLRLRFMVLRNFNRRFVRVLELIDLTRTDDESPLVAGVRRLRALFFRRVKVQLWSRVLTASHARQGEGAAVCDAAWMHTHKVPKVTLDRAVATMYRTKLATVEAERAAAALAQAVTVAAGVAGVAVSAVSTSAAGAGPGAGAGTGAGTGAGAGKPPRAGASAGGASTARSGAATVPAGAAPGSPAALLARAGNTIFGQMMQQLRYLAPPVLRNSERAFYTEFVGEHADDYGGPYRCVLTLVLCAMR
jgi:hypothetical protein